jgi:hypothetical protein
VGAAVKKVLGLLKVEDGVKTAFEKVVGVDVKNGFENEGVAEAAKPKPVVLLVAKVVGNEKGDVEVAVPAFVAAAVVVPVATAGGAAAPLS